MPALIFDCDGVLADTERDGHRPAFNQAFAEAGLGVVWDEAEYGRRLRIGGGKERIASLFPDADARRDQILDLHKRKTAIYKDIVRSGRLPGRPGIARIVNEALAAGWTLAVASTSAEESVRAVLQHVVGADVAANFAVFAGDVVPAKKPDPGIYLLALSELGVDAGDADRGRGLAQRAARRGRRRPPLRRHGQQLHDGRGHVRGGARRDEPRRSRRARARARQPQRGATGRRGEDRRPRDVPEGTDARGGCMSGTDRAELIVRTISQTAVDNERYFCELDAVAGDGDFGYSLARGFEIVLSGWDELEYDDAGGLLKKTAIVLTKRIGGTSGPIWGTAFLRAGGSLAGKPEPTGAEVVEAIRAAIEGIKQRGNADLGDKTLLDALVPATDTLEASLDQGAAAALDAAAATARESAEATTGMLAQRGRASYTGERSRDSPDAGAIGVAVMLEAVSRAWRESELERT